MNSLTTFDLFEGVKDSSAVAFSRPHFSPSFQLPCHWQQPTPVPLRTKRPATGSRLLLQQRWDLVQLHTNMASDRHLTQACIPTSLLHPAFSPPTPSLLRISDCSPVTAWDVRQHSFPCRTWGCHSMVSLLFLQPPLRSAGTSRRRLSLRHHQHMQHTTSLLQESTTTRRKHGCASRTSATPAQRPTTLRTLMTLSVVTHRLESQLKTWAAGRKPSAQSRTMCWWRCDAETSLLSCRARTTRTPWSGKLLRTSSTQILTLLPLAIPARQTRQWSSCSIDGKQSGDFIASGIASYGRLSTSSRALLQT